MTSEGPRLSPQQRRLRTLRGAAGAEHFRAEARVSVRGPVDADLLAQAVERVVQKHEILRTASADGGRFAPDGDGLVLSAPALCADWRSLENLAAEIAACYGSLRGEGSFEADAIQYADVAELMNELLADEESRPGLEFWRDRDVASGAGLALPFETPEPGAYAPAVLARALDPELACAVRAAAERLETSPRTFLLAAWLVLLRRLSAQADVLVGVGADGRQHEELAEPLGLFARHLPLPLSVAYGTSFGELLRAVDDELERMETWQDCFDRDDVLPFGFDYHAAAPEVTGGGATFVLEHRFVRSDRFKCRLVCEESKGTLALTFDYDAAVHGEPTIARLAEELQAVLASAAADPAAKVGRLDVLGAAERKALLVDFNDSDADYPKDLCAHRWIEEQARKAPERVAVRQGDRELTYGELDAWANQLAHHLQANGVGPDSLVALLVERSPEMVVAILGILKAGGAYVPVDPVYPADRIRFLLADTRAPVLVTQAKLDVPETDARVVRIDADAEAIARHPTEPPPSAVTPANLVYVIYTSGSTGKPKGVVITHEKLVISNTARVNAFGHTPDAFLLLSSVAFDSSVVGLFWTLCGGGTLELLPVGAEKEVGAIARAVADHGVTHLLTLPSFYRLILENSRAEDLASLKVAIVAGEACPLKMVEHHKRMLPGVGLFSEYGATETTVFSSVYDCLQQTLPIAPVGSPIDNAEMWILDEDLEPCPTGVAGEVHFGGIALALGYWRRPELTAERFVPHPFRGGPGARLYKSGDLARHLENGDVEFLGRLDNQVKIRGFRIELEEIEVALLKHPAVQESAVLAIPDPSGEKRLVGYVRPEAGVDAPTVGALREFLLVTLPDFMIPAVFVFLDDFPRTPNGKVDRKKLPEPGSERPELASTFAAPTSAAQETLAGIWADVLGLEAVGVDDNFFELGGDSILSIQIVSRAKQAGLKVTPLQLFENQTVASLAAVADFDAGAPAAEVEQGPVTGEVPLTPVQHWFFELDVPERNHFNMPLFVDVQRRVRSEDLEVALRALHAHHDALRLRFRREGDGWAQSTAPVGEEPTAFVVVEEAVGATDDEVDARAAAHQTALDVERGPLMRAVLFERGPDEPQRLLWIVHHLAVDGVSWRILLEDLDRALRQLEAGEGIALPPKTTSFQRWAGLLAGHAPERRAEADEWVARVGSAAKDRGDAGREAAARHVRVALEPEETRALLTEVPKTYNTQINDVLLTALVHAHATWSGEPSLLLNLEGHGREEIFDGVDLARTVGWFTTDYPLLLRDVVPFEPGAALRAVKEELRSAPDQGLGFGVARYLGDAETVARLRDLPRPAVGFNYMGRFDQVFRDAERFRYRDAPSGPEHDPAGERIFPLEVNGMVSDERLAVDFVYSEGLHDHAEIERLAAAFLEALRAVIEHCLSGDAGGFTASDFADFDWDESELGAIASAIQRTQAREGGG